ncbi:hypothetical protein FZC76_18130 [Sutcliffiella horikoshii]|uniref:Uncharacterized protein n=1 Tax=Sutcliffiella horikoshii TaxID=79883 RepID=A0A5D4SP35_9BACI|nr:hypothetical protein [Sutcliffiella horikoshii]TYS64481.1 hypothetical protein FZC76_18130 [Sutcliffiella horikoshii]
MKKVKTVGSITTFLRNGPVESEPLAIKLNDHFSKYSKVYQVTGLTVVFLTTGFVDVSLAAPVGAGIDELAEPIYRELLSVGKWIIICKGAISTFKSASDGDYEHAKKSFLSHVMIFLLLLSYPYAMDRIEQLFDRLN